MLTRSAVVYGCTAVIVMMLLSLLLTSTPDGASVLSAWAGTEDVESGIIAATSEQKQLHDSLSSNDLDTPGAEAHPPRPVKVEPVEPVKMEDDVAPIAVPAIAVPANNLPANAAAAPVAPVAPVTPVEPVAPVAPAPVAPAPVAPAPVVPAPVAEPVAPAKQEGFPTEAAKPMKTPHVNTGMPVYSTGGNGSVVLLTGSTDATNFIGVSDFYAKVTNNRLDYARAHGYEFMVVDLSSYVLTHTSHPVWGKLPAIIEAFDQYPNAEWIWWLDTDAIIMSPEVDLYNLLLAPNVMKSKLLVDLPIIVPDGWNPFDSGLRSDKIPDPSQIDFICAQDHNGINAGSFFIRNTPIMRLLVDLWSDPLIVEKEPTWPRREQDAFTYLVLQHASLRQRLGFVQQKFINAFTEGYPGMRWEEGDLTVHFAGCWVFGKCQEWFEDFWARRARINSTVT